MRLVVQPHYKARILEHTQDATFEWTDTNNAVQTATYRWLGGVYMSNSHYRVYWTDNERGESSNGEIRMYDSMLNFGLIIGGIPPEDARERVPAAWRDVPIPFLVYERILNPSSELLDSAIKSLSSMKAMQNNNKLILQEHTPWPRQDQANEESHHRLQIFKMSQAARFGTITVQEPRIVKTSGKVFQEETPPVASRNTPGTAEASPGETDKNPHSPSHLFLSSSSSLRKTKAREHFYSKDAYVNKEETGCRPEKAGVLTTETGVSKSPSSSYLSLTPSKRRKLMTHLICDDSGVQDAKARAQTCSERVSISTRAEQTMFSASPLPCSPSSSSSSCLSLSLSSSLSSSSSLPSKKRKVEVVNLIDSDDECQEATKDHEVRLRLRRYFLPIHHFLLSYNGHSLLMYIAPNGDEVSGTIHFQILKKTELKR